MPEKTIYVIEDEPSIVEVVSRYLRRAGYQVQSAADGQAAQQMLEKRLPDLVVLDLMLPGIDGYTLTRWLRAVGASDTEAYETLVAVGEACANAVAHAYPPGEASYVVEARRLDDGLEVRVRDFGAWRPPRSGSQGRSSCAF